jgi:hypothetical protein
MGNHKSTLTLRSNEVFIDVNSGLGNQLFMIATAYAYCQEHDKKLVLLDNVKHKYWDNIMGNCRQFLRPNLYKNVKSQHQYNEKEFMYSKIPSTKRNLYMKGFFQSEKYFKNYEAQIRNLFELPPELTKFVNEQFRKHHIYNNDVVVAVHIRRGDYLKLSDKHTIQPISYFNDAKQKMIELVGSPIRFIYFSDDPIWVKKMIDLRSRDIVISGYKDYEDFAIMQKCHHFIITNSTFSWWSAWLSKSFNQYLTIPNNIMLKDIKVKEKIVIAPSEWFGLKGPKEWNTVYPESWIVLNSKTKSFSQLFYLGIVTNEKTVDIDSRQFIDKNIPINYKFYIGNCGKEYTDKIVKLNCSDNSLLVFEKTYNALRDIIDSNPSVEYVIIANENAKFNFELLKTYSNSVYKEHIHYGGIEVKGEVSNYCKSDCYFLSRHAVSMILRFINIDERVKDEEKIAYCLSKVNIYPTNIDISRAIYR